MPHSFQRPLLIVDNDELDTLDGDNLSGLWLLFNKGRGALHDGERLENISWRLWYREIASSHSYRPLTPESPEGTNGSIKSPFAQGGHSSRSFQPYVVPRMPIGKVIRQMLPASTWSPQLPDSSLQSHLPLPTISSTIYPELQPSALPTPETELLSISIIPPNQMAAGSTSALSTPSSGPDAPESAPQRPCNSSSHSVSSSASTLAPQVVVVNPTPNPTPHPTPPATPILPATIPTDVPPLMPQQALTPQLLQRQDQTHLLSPPSATSGTNHHHRQSLTPVDVYSSASHFVLQHAPSRPPIPESLLHPPSTSLSSSSTNTTDNSAPSINTSSTSIAPSLKHAKSPESTLKPSDARIFFLQQRDSLSGSHSGGEGHGRRSSESDFSGSVSGDSRSPDPERRMPDSVQDNLIALGAGGSHINGTDTVVGANGRRRSRANSPSARGSTGESVSDVQHGRGLSEGSFASSTMSHDRSRSRSRGREQVLVASSTKGRKRGTGRVLGGKSARPALGMQRMSSHGSTGKNKAVEVDAKPTTILPQIPPLNELPRRSALPPIPPTPPPPSQSVRERTTKSRPTFNIGSHSSVGDGSRNSRSDESVSPDEVSRGHAGRSLAAPAVPPPFVPRGGLIAKLQMTSAGLPPAIPTPSTDLRDERARIAQASSKAEVRPVAPAPHVQQQPQTRQPSLATISALPHHGQPHVQPLLPQGLPMNDPIAAAAALLQPQGGKRLVYAASDSDDFMTTDTDDESWTSADEDEEEEEEVAVTKPENASNRTNGVSSTKSHQSHSHTRRGSTTSKSKLTQQPMAPPPPPPLQQQRQQHLYQVQPQPASRRNGTKSRAKSTADLLAENDARLVEAAEEAQRQRDMFAKVPQRSYSNLNRTRSGLLSQLMNPDPQIFPAEHPYRRAYTSGDVTGRGVVRLGIRPTTQSAGVSGAGPSATTGGITAGAPVPAAPERKGSGGSSGSVRRAPMGLQPSKSSAALPLADTVTATPNGSVSDRRPMLRRHATDDGSGISGIAKGKGKMVGSGDMSGGYRPKGRPQEQEMEDDTDDGEDDTLQLSKSIAQQKLAALASRRGIAPAQNGTANNNSGRGGPAPVPRYDDLPPWIEQQALATRNATALHPAPAPPPPPAPIQLAYPYNLPQHAVPSSPRTTRQLMLRTEMSESLRQNLLWQRQLSKTDVIGPRRRSSGALSNGLKPLTTIPNVVQLSAKKDAESRSLLAGGSGDVGGDRNGERRGSGGATDGQTGKEKTTLSRNRSWADEYHYAGW